MQIVIDIPEEDYKWIKEQIGVTDYQITQMLYNRVRKSTPLTEDTDLISRKAVKNYYPYDKKFHEWLDKQPTATPTRQKGKWITIDKGLKVTTYKCSECNRTVRDDTGYNVAEDYPYCHCGAKMVEPKESEKLTAISRSGKKTYTDMDKLQ